MEIQHHALNFKGILLFLVVLGICICHSQASGAQSPLFVVENVVADVTAENSVIAQEKAFEQAQLQAFRILAERMVSEAELSLMVEQDISIVSGLIKDYEVTNEQLSDVRYVGTYIFRFREQAVSNFFSNSGVHYTEAASQTLLVIPILQKNGQNTIWSEDNLWLKAWSNTSLPRSLVPVEVPIGDLADIADIDDTQALRYERTSLERMLKRYNASEAAIMLAIADDVFSELNIGVYRTDRGSAEHVQDVVVQKTETETVEQLFQRAVFNAHRILQQDWKQKTSASTFEKRVYRAYAEYRNIQQWLQMQTALQSTSRLSNFQTISVSRNQAFVQFDFAGTDNDLKEMLERTNLNLVVTRQDNQDIEDIEKDPNRIYRIFYGNRPERLEKQNSVSQPTSVVEKANHNIVQPEQFPEFDKNIHTF
ncbi:MAG: DUF2066 domain-containing protein [Alphaproteobacteria bacterium]|nr:DUF2066 domain-containing protein [Alphaproteobacteria bacterium]